MRNIQSNRSGFTLIELLIAVIIISILVTIIVPVISNRAADARLAAAKSDLEAIANAQSQVALDTGYLTRLHVLDDSGDPVGTDPAITARTTAVIRFVWKTRTLPARMPSMCLLT